MKSKGVRHMGNLTLEAAKIFDLLEKGEKYIEKCLEQYIDSQVPALNAPSAYFSKCIKEGGKVVGGVLAETHYTNVLFIDYMWVAEECRGKGYGAALMCEVEKLAVEAGCVVSHVSTYSFQSRGFYEKLGYTVLGIIADLPKEHSDIYMSKSLKDTAIIHNATSKAEIHDASEGEIDFIQYSLASYNKNCVPFTQKPSFVEFNKCMKDGDEIVAGIIAGAYCWNVLEIDAL